jgi:large-conductance mechanosensitive channel
MTWIKNAVIDIAITAVIGVFAFTAATWSWWIIAIYTPLMVLLKLFALSGAATAVKQKADQVPTWFYHVLYAANLVFLLIGVFYWAAAGWAAIWILSVVVESKNRPSKKRAA